MIKPDIAAAMREREEGRTELLNRVLTLTDDQLAALPIEQILRIGPEALLRTLGPVRRSAESEAPKEAASQQVPAKPQGEPIPGWKRRWLGFEPFWRATAVGSIWGTGISAALAAVLWLSPIGFGRLITPPPAGPPWRLCTRLSLSTNGCYYRVRDGISWEQAAGDLGMDEDVLRQNNPVLSTYTVIPAGQAIAIWR